MERQRNMFRGIRTKAPLNMRWLFAASLALVIGLIVGWATEAPFGLTKQHETRVVITATEQPKPAPAPTPSADLTAKRGLEAIEAIDLLKPEDLRKRDRHSKAAQELAKAFRSSDYYFHATYKDETERINHEDDPADPSSDEEIEITPKGMIKAVADGNRSKGWYVICDSGSTMPATPDLLDPLVDIADKAAKGAWEAYVGCKYHKYKTS